MLFEIFRISFCIFDAKKSYLIKLYNVQILFENLVGFSFSSKQINLSGSELESFIILNSTFWKVECMKMMEYNTQKMNNTSPMHVFEWTHSSEVIRFVEIT